MAVERAIKNSGSATKESVQAELSKFNKEDFWIVPPVTFANCQRSGVLTNGIMTVKGGKLTPLTPPTLEAVPGAKEKMGYLWGGGCPK
ncbi:MAG: hypothetical protein A2Z02_00015 [Chloroflexi bacterium RBG_16_48_7]|nr:MAG: hypothetical protein A2Z02_00015 [Chloroflexi bacterium RBG_16_48_7]